MDRDAAKQIILDLVTDMQGCKATELAIRLGGIKELTDAFSTVDIVYIIDELIASKELVEVTYILPTRSYRTKSFLLPKGSKVTITP